MKTKTLLLLLLILAMATSSVLVVKNLNSKPKKIKVDWSMRKLKKVPPKFKISLRSTSYSPDVFKVKNMAKRRDVIVIGQIVKISNYLASKLSAPISHPLYNQPMVYRDIAVAIEEVVKGKVNQPFLTARVYGGKLSEEQQVDIGQDAAEFKQDEKVILFLYEPDKGGNVEDGVPHFNLWSAAYTKFAIIGNEAVRGPYELPLPAIEKQKEDERDRPLSNPAPMGLSVDERRFPLDKILAEIKANL